MALDAQGNEISGYTSTGFDFNSYLDKVDSSLSTWGVNALDRQLGIDNGSKGKGSGTPPVQLTVSGISSKTWVILGAVAGLVVLLVWVIARRKVRS